MNFIAIHSMKLFKDTESVWNKHYEKLLFAVFICPGLEELCALVE